MRTAMISDLHLGVTSGADLLRRRRFRELLLDAVSDCDRLVLLGDVLELRDRPVAEVLDEAAPFFEEIGDAFSGKAVVLVPGNHDHRLLGPWLERRGGSSPPGPAELIDLPGPAVETIAARLGGARLEVRYPGAWVRDDVYATHGHYLDSHLTLPTIERLAIASIDRIRSDRPGSRSGPADYEHVHAPLYDLLFSLAQGASGASSWTQRKGPSSRLWEMMGGASGRARTLRGRLLQSAVVPAVLEGLERSGVGRFGRDFSLAEVGRAGVAAMHEVVRSLGIRPRHVIFGHIHRAGPLGGEDGRSAADPPWERDGLALWNAGCWVYAPSMIGTVPRGGTFWPGTAVVVDGDGPPELVRLLDGYGHDQLRPPAQAPPTT